MNERHPLRAEYEALLRRNGVPVPPSFGPYADVLGWMNSEINLVLARSGIPLPAGQVYVAPYPHPSFDSQAVPVPGGSVILINTGFLSLVFEVTRVMSSSVQSFTRNSDGSIDVHRPTEDFRIRERMAYAALARSLLTYIDSGKSWVSPSQPLSEGWRKSEALIGAWAILRFVIAHEFGHVLAGHLTSAFSEGGSGGWQKEREADQLGALILLRQIDEHDDDPQKYWTASGPFAFFAIDHLITRVRNEVVGIPHGLVDASHPPSDERAAALRDLFIESHGPTILHVADCHVEWMSWREEPILAEATKMLRSG